MSGRRLAYDRILFGAAAVLVTLGIAMVGSSSVFTEAASGGGGSRFLLRQVIHATAGLAALLLFMRIDYSRYDSSWVLGATLVGAFALLVVVLFLPPINNAHRWLRIGPVTIQVSEVAKLALALFIAYTVEHKRREIAGGGRGVIPFLVISGSLAGLVLIEPDTGTAFLMGGLILAFLFLGGAPLRTVGLIAGGGAAGLAVLVFASPYRLARWKAWLDPYADPQGAGFQIIQSRIAFGEGGLTGVGFGDGRQKAFYLPYANSDFIYSMVGEELGLIGALVVLALFGVIAYRGFRAALHAPDSFGTHLGMALTLLIVMQALLHMGVATTLLPTKGLTLPFVSYGGSSLVATMAATGILMNISQHSN